MSSSLASNPNVSHKDIQVSGLKWFSESRWREAILYYLFGVWSNNDDVVYRPKINFGDITLRLDRTRGTYYAYGHPSAMELPPLARPECLMVVRSDTQVAVEVALIRFVKDNRIKQLWLHLPSLSSHSAFVLWKKDRRSEYGYAGVSLPYTWGTQGAVWTCEEFEGR